MKNKHIVLTLATVLFSASVLTGCSHTHTYTLVSGKDATCKDTGVVEHYKCNGCNKTFDMDKVEKEESTFIVPVRDHIASDLTHHDPVAGSDCQHKGTIEYWQCNTCSKYFSDGNGKNQISSIEGQAGQHNYVEHKAKAPTCTEDGNELYYSCSVPGCNKVFDATKKEIASIPVIEHIGHNLTEHPAVPAADCTTRGKAAYWTCENAGCGKMFADAQGSKEVTEIPEGDFGPHPSLENHPATAATCEGEGNLEYWSCATCSKLFSDAEGKIQTTLADVTLNPLGHAMSTEWTTNETKHWHKCNREGCTHIEDEALHTFGDWVVDVKPSWPDKGLKHRLCSVCEYKEEQEIEPILTAAMVIEAIDNIPETKDYKGEYNGLTDPFFNNAENMINAFLTAGGSKADITNLNKFLSYANSLALYDVTENKVIKADILEHSYFTDDGGKDNVNLGRKYVINQEIGEYKNLCSFDKTKVADIKEKLEGTNTISFGIKVLSTDMKVQPQISYYKEDGSIGYKGPSGVGVTTAGTWLLLTLDSTWVDLILSDTFNMFYVTTMTGQTTLPVGTEIVVADLYLDKTITPSTSVSEGWTSGTNQTVFAGNTGGTEGYDSTLFTSIQSQVNVDLPFYNVNSSTLTLKANSDISSETVVNIRPENINGKLMRFAFFVTGEITISKIEFVKGNAITGAKDTITDEPFDYRTGWHYVDTINASTQYYGYFIFTISSAKQDSSIMIGKFAALTKAA